HSKTSSMKIKLTLIGALAHRRSGIGSRRNLIDAEDVINTTCKQECSDRHRHAHAPREPRLLVARRVPADAGIRKRITHDLTPAEFIMHFQRGTRPHSSRSWRSSSAADTA